MGIHHLTARAFVALGLSGFMAASQADAQTLVTSLLLERSTTDGIYDSAASRHFTIDDGAGVVLTRGADGLNGGHGETSIGAVQGTFNLLTSHDAIEGAEVDYQGAWVRNFTNNTVFREVNRFGNDRSGGLLTWDYDLSTYLTGKMIGTSGGESSFKLDVFWGERRTQTGSGGGRDGRFFISVNDGSLVLDTTDVADITPSQHLANALVTDRQETDIFGDGVVGGDDFLGIQRQGVVGPGVAKWVDQYGSTSSPNPNYQQIGVLPFDAVVDFTDPITGRTGTQISFDITDYLANSTDKVIRLAYLETEFRGDIAFNAGSGIVETVNPAVSAIPEPSTLMLGVLVMGGLQGIRRNR